MGGERACCQHGTAYLLKCLHELPATGSEGFEGLVRDLMERWTGLTFRLARSGYQHGHDAAADSSSGIELLVEAKRYQEDTQLSSRSLVGEFAQALETYPSLELWVLAASKEVGSNEARTLENAAQREGVDVLILDSRSNDFGPLQVFLAAYRDTTEAFLQGHLQTVDRGRLSACLDAVQWAPGFSEAVDRMRRDLSARVLGFEGTRNRTAGFLSRGLESIPNAMGAFGEDIALNCEGRLSPVPRAAISTALDQWWTDQDAPGTFCLLGEEGTGKTWAAVAWLMDRAEDEHGPLVLTVTPKKIATGGLKEILVDALQRSASRPAGAREVRWERSLGRWLGREPDGHPRILLLLDGLSERSDLSWREILWEIAGTDWAKRLSVVVTCRPAYWNRHLEGSAIHAEKHVTEGFTDDELLEVVDRSGHSLDQIPDDLKPLIRKPRYCRIVLEHLSALLDSGELTVERLLYIDYRQRHGQKLGQPLDKRGFDELLATLASRCLEEWRQAPGNEVTFSSRQLSDSLPGDVEPRAALQEIIDGGLMVENGRPRGGYLVEPRRLVHGLGMLLADELRKEAGNDVDTAADRVRTWLEPQPDMDMKAGVLGAAVFFSLPDVCESYPVTARRALLREWIAARNLSEAQQKEIGSYLSLCAADVLDVADHYWRDDINDRLAQDRLAQALMDRRDVGEVDSALVAAIERWMGYVHVAGDPFLRRIHDDTKKGPSPGEKLAESLGCELSPGECARFRNWLLPVTAHDGHLRLSRFALLLISGGKRAPHAEAFVRWAVSRQLMGYSSEHEEVSWTLRLSDEDLWPSLGPKLTKMSRAANEIEAKAARVLGDCLGVPENTALRAELEDESLPAEQVPVEDSDDPCIPTYAWRAEDCDECLGRGDIELHMLVRGVKKFCTNPAIRCPKDFVKRLEAAGEALEVHRYHAEGQTTRADIHIDDIMPVLARFSPTASGEVWRGVVRSIQARDLEGQRLLALQLAGLALVLGDHERDLLDQFVKDQGKTSDFWPDRSDGSEGGKRRTSEAFAFLGLAMLLRPEEVVSRLLERPSNALDMLRLEGWLGPLPDDFVADLARQLLEETDSQTVARILWVLSISPGSFDSAQRDCIAGLMGAEDSTVKTTALRAAVTSGDDYLARRVIEDGSEYRDRDGSLTSQWGQVLLCRHASALELEELIRRLPLASVGRAIMQRGPRNDEVDVYAHLIETGLKSLIQGDDQPHLPPVVLETEGACENERALYEVRQEKHGRSLLSPGSTWGGTASQWSVDDFKRAFSADSGSFEDRQAEHLAELRRLLREDAEGWCSSPFDVASLREICTRQPERVRGWVKAALGEDLQTKRLRRAAGGFYQSLNVALASEEPQLALELWRQLMASELPVSLTHRLAKTEWLRCIPFEMADSSEVVDARRRLLEEANSDSALLELVTAAQTCGQAEWLLEEARRMIALPPLWRRAKGLMIGAMVDGPVEEYESIEREAEIGNSWVGELTPAIRSIRDRNCWARHWYWQFLTSPNRDEAYAGFELFLHCVDRRCVLWICSLEEEAREMAGFEERRVSFRATNNNKVWKAIERNERESKDRFLTIKFRTGELVGLGSPWRQ